MRDESCGLLSLAITETEFRVASRTPNLLSALKVESRACRCLSMLIMTLILVLSLDPLPCSLQQVAPGGGGGGVTLGIAICSALAPPSFSSLPECA